jgi:hypothetical protein
MKRADPSKKDFRPYAKKLRKFSCAPFGLVQPEESYAAQVALNLLRNVNSASPGLETGM